VQDRDGGLDESLVEALILAVRVLPDFFPRLVAFEEPPRVEERDPLLESFAIVLARHRSRA